MKILDGLPDEPLTPEREQAIAGELVDAVISADKREALKVLLVLHSMREAFFYARKCARGRLPDDEVYSLVYSALIRATGPFQAGQKRFFAYAKAAIRGEIFREWRKKRTIKHVAPSDVFHPAGAGLDELHGTEGRFAITGKTVRLGLDEDIFLPHERQYGQKVPVVELSQEPDLNSIHERELGGILNEVTLKTLSDRERQVIELHYKKGLTFREIGETLGMLRKTASAAHQRALKKLRLALERSKKVL